MYKVYGTDEDIEHFKKAVARRTLFQKLIHLFQRFEYINIYKK